jgi:hypothetical protein
VHLVVAWLNGEDIPKNSPLWEEIKKWLAVEYDTTINNVYI